MSALAAKSSSKSMSLYEKDISKAVYFLKASDIGLPEAQVVLGKMYYDGLHFKEQKSAITKLAAAQGHISAQFNLGYA